MIKRRAAGRAWWGTLTSLALSGAGCSADSNVFTYTTPDGHYETFEALLDQGRAAYDRNELSDALRYTKRAYEMNSKSERASLLYGLVNLSLAGGDPLGLAKAMIADSERKDADASLSLASSSAGETLTSLKDVLGITDDELEELGTLDDTDPTLPLLIPKCVEGSRSVSARLAYLNEAILAVCPFTDGGVRTDSDYRQQCGSFPHGGTRTNQAHVVWAFAHLTEALTFHAVLTYGSADPEGKKSNLELRVERLDDVDTSTPDGITALVSAVEALTATIDAVMPTRGTCSEAEPTTQIRATLNDLLAVDAAFRHLAGVPTKISGGIRRAVERINAVAGAGEAPVVSQTDALKRDLSKQTAATLAATIDALAADPEQPLSEDERVKLCTAFGTLAPDPTISTSCTP